MTTISYLRVSTSDQNTEKFKAAVLKFANGRDLGKVKFVEEQVSGKVPWKERKIGTIVDDLGKGDVLIVPELSRLSRSLVDVLNILEATTAKGISVFSVKEGLELSDGNPFNKAMVSMLGIVAQLERDLISLRTKEALAAKKASGVKLGRPKGPGKSKLDPFAAEIFAFLDTGSTKKWIAEKYGCTPANLINWLKRNKRPE